MSNEEILKKVRCDEMEIAEAREMLILNNTRLVDYIIKNYNKGLIEKEDLYQTGVVGLIKAVDWLIDKGLKQELKVSTYMARCIENEVLMYLRGIYTQKRMAMMYGVSIYKPLSEDNDLCIMDTIEVQTNNELSIIEKSVSTQIKSIIRYKLTPRQRLIMESRYYVDDPKTLRQIGKELNLTKQMISKEELDAIKKIREILDIDENY